MASVQNATSVSVFIRVETARVQCASTGYWPGKLKPGGALNPGLGVAEPADLG
jgi:hypothetical protein